MTTTRQPAVWSYDAALAAFRAITPSTDPDDGAPGLIVLTDEQLARLRPIVATARAVGFCLQCDPAFPEVWAPVPNWPHLASSHGDTRSRRRVLTRRDMNRPQGPGPKYQQIDLCAGGRQMTVPVHQVLLAAFEGPRPGDNYDSCHADDHPDHNHWGNLFYDTEIANAAMKSGQPGYAAKAGARSDASRRAQAAGAARLAALRDADRAAAQRDEHAASPARGPFTAWLRRHGLWPRRSR
jgi:hypothetical protein